MIKNDPDTTQSEENFGRKQATPCSPHLIRFLDSEWECIEQAAKARRVNAAEPVRHATLRFATDRFTTSSDVFPSEVVARIDPIYRGVYPAFNAEAQ